MSTIYSMAEVPAYKVSLTLSSSLHPHAGRGYSTGETDKSRSQAIVNGLYPALGHQTHCRAAYAPGVNAMVGVPFPAAPMAGQLPQPTQIALCFLVPHSLRRCGTANAPCIVAGSPGLERAKSKGCSRADPLSLPLKGRDYSTRYANESQLRR